MVQGFTVNYLNQLTNITRTGTLTVSGAVLGAATNVTVNGGGAILYSDNSFAREALSLADGDNSFTAVARDSLGRAGTNTVTANLPATVSPAYDANGNMVTNGPRLLAYDDENQLVSVQVPGQWKSDFQYDGKMRRRVRTEAIYASGAWLTNLIVRYVYDGNLVVQERHFNVVAGALVPRETVAYTRGRDLSGTLEGAGGIGGLLARSSRIAGAAGALAHAYYHSDANGNVTALASASGSLIGRYLYDPFGNTLGVAGAAAEANLYRFSSKEWHAASGLVYYLYRYYEPSLQRWANRDPIGEGGGFNLYAFADNDPRDKIDPLGLYRDSPSSHPDTLADLIIDEILASDGSGMTRTQVIKRMSLCAAIHAAYKVADCKSCRWTCISKAEAASRAGCWARQIALRSVYLRLKCDHFLVGSRRKGSDEAEKGHRDQILMNTKVMVECTAKAAP